jgi:hypothetical protein
VEGLWYHCAVLARSVLRSALFAVVALVLTAAPALAQTPAVSPTGGTSIPKAAAPWTYYMAIATIAIAVLTLILTVLGYVVQAPGFRRGQRSGQAS